MNRTALAIAIAEAERFLKRAKSLPKIGKYESCGRTYPHDNFPIEQGAIMRASMDLTRALAQLRKGNRS